MKKNNPNTKAMEEALQSAVARMQQAPAPGAGAGMAMPDPLGMAMAVLPKLLEGNGAREDLLEKLEELQQEDISALRKQLDVQTQLLERVFRAQKLLLRQVRTLEDSQRTTESAVLELAEQMERVQILEEIPGDTEVYDEPARGFEQQRPKLRLAHVRARQKSVNR